MKEYRITKYNPANRVDGRYALDEWTSFSDIGKQFDGAELSYAKYLETENAYIDCCVELIKKSRIQCLSVVQAECYNEELNLPTRISNTVEIRKLISACLREKCWFKLMARDFFIHFGYDYHMYIGSALPAEIIEEVSTRFGLYCELCPSPYNACE